MNNYEIKEVISLSFSDRYHYTIRKIAETEQLWTVISIDGHFTLAEIGQSTVISLWTEEDFIESNLTPDWADCVPFKLSLSDLEELLVPIIRQNNYRINIFPVNGRIGQIVNHSRFIDDLNRELANC